MKNKKYLSALYLSALAVGLYQLPMIDNKLNAQSLNFNLNDKVSFPQEIQQSVENTKISLSASLEDYKPFVKESDAQPIQVAQAQYTPAPQAPVVPKAPNVKEKKAFEPVLSQNTQVSVINETLPVKKQPVETVQQEVSRKVAEVKKNCVENCKLLLIGDSVMGDVYFSLSRYLKKEQPTWTIINAHKVSSGLTNQGYYDWPKINQQLVETHKPNYVLVLMGTNDAQNMIVNGKATVFGKDAWQEEYKNRVRKITANLDKNTEKWMWIQLPTVKSPNFNEKLSIIRDSQSEVVNGHYIRTDSLLGEDPSKVDMKLRAKDGTHLNAKGADMVAKYAYEELFKQVK